MRGVRRYRYLAPALAGTGAVMLVTGAGLLGGVQHPGGLLVTEGVIIALIWVAFLAAALGSRRGRR